MEILLATTGITLSSTGAGDITFDSASGNINLASGDDILPVGANSNLGSAGVKFNTLYVDTIQATTLIGTVSGGATTSEDWTINSDNATADTETMNLIFERGTTTPNALITWDVTNKEFDTNSTWHLTSSISSAVGLQLGGFTTDITTDAGEALTLQSGTTSTNSATGGGLTLNAGNATGTTTTGGSVNIDAGTGTSANGTISIGASNAVTIDIAGGSSSTGCTITNATGSLVCSGINSTPVGATSPSTGAFTTLSSTGATTLGDNSSTVAVDTTSWDISSAGAASGLTGVSSSGTITFSGLATGVVINSNGTLSSEAQLAISRGGTGASTLNDLITLGTHTTGNYVASITTGVGLTGTWLLVKGSTPTLAVGAGTGITVNADDVAINQDTSLYFD